MKDSERMFRFSTFELDRATGELTENGRRVKLHPQPAKLLCLFVRRAGEVVTREEIQKQVWGAETFVDYDLGINSCVRQIRKALRDDAEEPRFVQTIPGSGYRFIGAERLKSPPKRSFWPFTAATGLALAAAAWAVWEREASPPPPLVIPVTAEEGFEIMPALSPSGDRVAYVARRENGDHIEVKHVAGGTPLGLASFHGRLFRPTWTPDGDEIAYQRALPGGKYDVVTVPALGGAERTLVMVHPKNVDANGLSYSPDGRTLAMVDAEESLPNGGIVLLSLESGEKRPLTSTPAGFYDTRPTFSPDGSTVAFLRRRGRGASGRVFAQRVDRDAALALTTRETRIYGLDWTADGNALVFSAPRVESWENVLWRVPASGGEPEPLPYGQSAGALSLSRRGNRLAYDRPTHEYNLWRVRGPAAAVSSPPEKFLFSTRDEFVPAYSTDGSKIAFVSDREGTWALWIAGEDGSRPRLLTEGTSFLYPKWSPDGRELAFHSSFASQSPPAIYTIQERGGIPRKVGGTEGGHLPSWSQDGKWIYFTKLEGDSPQIWKVPRQGGEAVRVTRGGGAEPKSGSGKRIFYRIGFRLAATGVEDDDETAYEKVIRAHASLWDVWDDKLVYVNAHGEALPRVELYDPATNETRIVAELPSHSNPRHGLSVSPDGRWILIGSDDGDGSDILVLEGFH